MIRDKQPSAFDRSLKLINRLRTGDNIVLTLAGCVVGSFIGMMLIALVVWWSR